MVGKMGRETYKGSMNVCFTCKVKAWVLMTLLGAKFQPKVEFEQGIYEGGQVKTFGSMRDRKEEVRRGEEKH